MNEMRKLMESVTPLFEYQDRYPDLDPEEAKEAREDDWHESVGGMLYDIGTTLDEKIKRFEYIAKKWHAAGYDKEFPESMKALQTATALIRKADQALQTGRKDIQ
jgi:hypothetical protein